MEVIVKSQNGEPQRIQRKKIGKSEGLLSLLNRTSLLMRKMQSLGFKCAIVGLNVVIAIMVFSVKFKKSFFAIS